MPLLVDQRAGRAVNYRHAFHAGNFADVFKHALLTRLFVYLTAKPAPLFALDTHAGLGFYDLNSEEATRTGEWRDGIGRVIGADLGAAADLLAPYMTIVGAADADNRPLRYPGSPAILAALKRRDDRLICCELHDDDVKRLGEAVGRRAKVLAMDGYTALKAFVPPKERRGLVLVDPPFESRDEFDAMARAFLAAYAKWPTGTYGLWYPVKDPAGPEALIDAIRHAGVRRVLRLELRVARRDPDAPLSATGMLIINPPFVFPAEAGVILPVLVRLLGRDDRAGHMLDWVVGE